MRRFAMVALLVLLVGCTQIPVDVTQKMDRLVGNCTYLDGQWKTYTQKGEFDLQAPLPGGEDHVCLKETGPEAQQVKHKIHLVLLSGANAALARSLRDWCAGHDDDETNDSK